MSQASGVYTNIWGCQNGGYRATWGGGGGVKWKLFQFWGVEAIFYLSEGRAVDLASLVVLRGRTPTSPYRQHHQTAILRRDDELA